MNGFDRGIYLVAIVIVTILYRLFIGVITVSTLVPLCCFAPLRANVCDSPGPASLQMTLLKL